MSFKNRKESGMGRIKRLLSVVSAGIMSVSSLFVLAPIVHAAGNTCTWTGTADLKFMTVANWSGCGGVAPNGGDSLVFNNTSLASNATLNNDIVGLVVGSMSFSGSGSYGFTISGNGFTIDGGVAQNASAKVILNLDITLGADQTFAYGSDLLVIGDQLSQTAHTLALGSYALTLSGSGQCAGITVFSALTGSGTLTDNVTNVIKLNADSPSYTGAIAINSGYLSAETSLALGATSAGTAVASGAALALGFSSDTTFAEPLTLSGTGNSGNGTLLLLDNDGFIGCMGGIPPETPHTATLSGSIILQSDVTVAGDVNHNATITGALSGAHTITVAPGHQNTLTVNSSNNTSNTPNGSLTAPVQTLTIADGDNQPSTYVNVGVNQTYIIDGIRGQIGVDLGGY